MLKGLAAALAVVLLLCSLYVMRNFFGFWAPGAGEGLTADASMSDEEKIFEVLRTMDRAFVNDDVDLFMTTIADDFKDEEGNTKTKLRVALQAYHERGDFKSVRVDFSDVEFLDKDGYLYARPVKIRTADEEFSIYLGFKSYWGKLLVATGSAP